MFDAVEIWIGTDARVSGSLPVLQGILLSKHNSYIMPQKKANLKLAKAKKDPSIDT